MNTYDVELPDGTVVEGIPEGTTQAELVRRLQRAGIDTSWYQPERRTLDDRMAERTQLEEQAGTLRAQESALERRIANAVQRQWMNATGGVLRPGYDVIQEAVAWATENAPSEATEQLQDLKAQRAQLEASLERLGVGSTGQRIGSVAGALLGGGLGSLASPILGTIGGSAAGAAAGSYLGSKWDIANAEDVTAEEAEQLIYDRVVEDVLTDAAGSLLFVVGGKLLKVTGATQGLKKFAQRFIDGPAGRAGDLAELAEERAKQLAKVKAEEEAAEEAARVVPRYVTPGEEGYRANRLEDLPIIGSGRKVAEDLASEINQRTTNERAARALGLKHDTQITRELLEEIREEAGKAYEAIRRIPGSVNLRNDRAFGKALMVARARYMAEGVPLDAVDKEVVNRITALSHMKDAAPHSILGMAKRLREKGRSFGYKGDREAAGVMRDLADSLDDLLERSLQARNDPSIANSVQDYIKARRTIARTYTIEDALRGSDVDARVLGRRLAGRKLPTKDNDDLVAAAKFAQDNARAARPNIDGSPGGNMLSDALLATGGSLVSGSPAGAAAPFFRRYAGVALLRGLYEAASQAGDREAMKHAARARALVLSGALTGAKLAMFKESLRALRNSGYDVSGIEE
jgi:hypothetical protein